jgi:hypothetical protein
LRRVQKRHDMSLTDEQKKTVAGWLEAGLSVADVQSRLAAEFSVKMTYMEVRFLLDDLALAPKDIAEETPEADDAAANSDELPVTDAEAVLDELGGEGGLPGGGVSVTTDQVVRPGALASGKVTFSDGKQAAWYLDQFGRLGVVADDKSYKPSQEDLMDFQDQLQRELARMGM